MDNVQVQTRHIEAMTWGSLLVWWGINELVDFFPKGIGAIGIGLILLGSNVLRTRYGVPRSGFGIAIGIVALVWGGLELVGAVASLPFELPVFAVLLIVLGIIVLAPALTKNKNL